MRPAAYARVSTDEQASRDSPIASQLERLRERGPLVEEVIDEGWSGADPTRPGIRRLLALAEERAIDTVLVWDWSRLARDAELFHWLRREFRTRGVEVVSLSDSDSPLETDIRAAIAAEQRRKIAADVRRSMQHRARQAQPNGGRVYGYRWQDGRREIVPDEAATVREIFAAADEGVALTAIAQRVDWDRARVARTLRNPTYAGIYVWGRTRAKPPGARGKQPRQPRDAWVMVEDAHPAIVARDAWDRVQARLDGQARRGHAGPSPGVASLPLSGLLRCGVCDRSMRVTGLHRGVHYYACPCLGHVGTRDWPERIAAHLARSLATRAIAREIATAYETGRQSGRAEGTLEAEIAQLRRAEAATLRAITSGLIEDTTALAGELGRTQRVIARTQASLARVRAQAPRMSVRDVLATLEAAAGAIAHANGAQLRAVLHRMLREVRVLDRATLELVPRYDGIIGAPAVEVSGPRIPLDWSA